jgi:hypothetical protein
MDNAEIIRAEVEQNANILYKEMRELVMEMNPSIAAVTIAFSMLFRESTKMLISSDWTNGQRDLYGDIVNKLVDHKVADAFNEACAECEQLVNPAISDGAFLIEYVGNTKN